MTSTPGSYSLYPGTPSPDWWNAPTNPMSIGAGTSEQGYGWGVPAFGAAPVQILPANLAGLSNPALAPGYIPGSGTYNQYDLSQGTLFGNIGGVLSNLNYGVGGRGDPTNGLEPQSPEDWVTGEWAFTWDGNLGTRWNNGTEGLDFIPTLFGRGDTASGVSTAAANAPPQYWEGLAQAVAKGIVKPSAHGWQILKSKGYTAEKIGGVAPQQAAAVLSGGAGGAGAAGDATQNALASIAASQAADQAARQAFVLWQMRTGDEQLAMQKAQAEWSRVFQERQQSFSEGTTAAGLTGQYNGAQTQQAQQQAFAQDLANRQFAATQQQNQAGNALALLSQQSALQGPRSWAAYQALNQNTPGGLKDMLAGFAGQYGFAGSVGSGTPGAATLQSRTQDLLSGGQLGSAGQQQAAQPTAGGTPAQNGFALPAPNQINLANYQNATPSQREMLLGAFESQGYWGPDVEAQIRNSAPRFAGPTGTQVALR